MALVAWRAIVKVICNPWNGLPGGVWILVMNGFCRNANNEKVITAINTSSIQYFQWLSLSDFSVVPFIFMQVLYLQNIITHTDGNLISLPTPTPCAETFRNYWQFPDYLIFRADLWRQGSKEMFSTQWNEWDLWKKIAICLWRKFSGWIITLILRAWLQSK